MIFIMSNFLSEGMFCLHVTEVRISLLRTVGGEKCLDICIIFVCRFNHRKPRNNLISLERLFQSKIQVENAWKCYLLRVTFCFTGEGTSDNWGNKDICRLGASGSGVDLSEFWWCVWSSSSTWNYFCSERLVRLCGIEKCDNILNK